MKDLPYLCKRDVFCVFRNAVIGFVVWFFAMNFIAWCDYSGTSFATPYNQYNPYGVYIQKYCQGDSTNKEMAFRKYVGSKAYFDDMRDYGIELEKIPVLFYDIQCLRTNSRRLPDGISANYIMPSYSVFRDTQHLCEIAGMDYSKWKNNMESASDSYSNLVWHGDSEDRFLAEMPYFHVESRRVLLNKSLLQEDLRVQESSRRAFLWWNIISTRNPKFKVNYKWLLALFN